MQTINLVWLKRDLRLTDHLPLQHALSSENPTVLLYILSPCCWMTHITPNVIGALFGNHSKTWTYSLLNMIKRSQ